MAYNAAESEVMVLTKLLFSPDAIVSLTAGRAAADHIQTGYGILRGLVSIAPIRIL